jgi:hypothetical protein
MYHSLEASKYSQQSKAQVVALLKFGVDYETLVENTEIRYAFKYFRLNGENNLSCPL